MTPRNIFTGLAVGLVMLASSVPAAASKATNSFEKLQEMGLNPKSVVEMPIDGMVAYESQSGEILLMSSDGRYVIDGVISDVWDKKVLQTGADMLRSAHSIPLSEMEIDFDQLDALTMGKGSKVVYVVTDPLCSACKKLNDEMQSLTDEYTFKILALPALGDMSREVTRKIACETDREKALKALLDGTADKLPAPQNCNLDAYKQALLLADYIGVREVPFLIGPNYKVNRGLPRAGLEPWLNSESSFISTTSQVKPRPAPQIRSAIPVSNDAQAPQTLNDRIRNAIK